MSRAGWASGKFEPVRSCNPRSRCLGPSATAKPMSAKIAVSFVNHLRDRVGHGRSRPTASRTGKCYVHTLGVEPRLERHILKRLAPRRQRRIDTILEGDEVGLLGFVVSSGGNVVVFTAIEPFLPSAATRTVSSRLHRRRPRLRSVIVVGELRGIGHRQLALAASIRMTGRSVFTAFAAGLRQHQRPDRDDGSVIKHMRDKHPSRPRPLPFGRGNSRFGPRQAMKGRSRLPSQSWSGRTSRARTSGCPNRNTAKPIWGCRPAAVHQVAHPGSVAPYVAQGLVDRAEECAALLPPLVVGKLIRR